MKDIQKMYEYCIGQIRKAGAREEIENACGRTTGRDSGRENGRKQAYSDMARRLVDAGAKVSVIILCLLLCGCSNTTATYRDGETTITRWRLLMTEDIGSASFDANDGSFTIDGYKSDMTHALDLIKLLAEKDEVKP